MLQTPAKNFPIKWYTLPWWFCLQLCVWTEKAAMLFRYEPSFRLKTEPIQEVLWSTGQPQPPGSLRAAGPSGGGISAASQSPWMGILIHPGPICLGTAQTPTASFTPFSPNSWSAAALAATQKCHEEGQSSPGKGLSDFPWWVPRPVLSSHISLTSQDSTFVEDAAQGRVGGISRRGKTQHCCEPAPNRVWEHASIWFTLAGIILNFQTCLTQLSHHYRQGPVLEHFPSRTGFGLCTSGAEWRNWFLFPGVYYKHDPEWGSFKLFPGLLMLALFLLHY